MNERRLIDEIKAVNDVCTCQSCERRRKKHNSQHKPRFDSISIIKAVALTLILCGAAFLLTSCNAYADNTLTPQKAVLACMGEAEGESQTGKIAMMEALRNRNSLEGVYGYKAIKLINGKYHKKVMKSGKYFKRTGKAYRPLSDMTVTACQAAWVDSAYTNYVKGADHWEAVQTFGRPKWAKGMIQTAKIGSHTFFKSR